MSFMLAIPGRALERGHPCPPERAQHAHVLDLLTNSRFALMRARMPALRSVIQVQIHASVQVADLVSITIE
jgi:hypothetical protein